jgi:Sulfotransferase family
MANAVRNHAQIFVNLLIVLAVALLLVNFTHMRSLEFTMVTHAAARTKMTNTSDVNVPDSSLRAAANVRETIHVRSNDMVYRRIPKRNPEVQRDLVLPGDYIYYSENDSWDSAPIVIESHKLMFFSIPKVGCTVWKQLFRRMMGYADWASQDYETYQPHNPKVNGLKYLYNYSVEEASVMMTSPEWTRALMVRDPKTRFLSAFLDKSVGNFHLHIKRRCCPDESCIGDAQTLEGFVRLCTKCYDDHWRPQSDRVDYKYWPYIDHIGHVETSAADAKDLLQQIGAWEEFGASGWGDGGQSAIFASRESSGSGMNHTTYADQQIWTWYTPETEQLVERFYMGDYENPLFHFTRGECLTCVE